MMKISDGASFKDGLSFCSALRAYALKDVSDSLNQIDSLSKQIERMYNDRNNSPNNKDAYATVEELSSALSSCRETIDDISDSIKEEIRILDYLNRACEKNNYLSEIEKKINKPIREGHII